MSNFTSLLRSPLEAAGPNSENKMQISNGRIQEVDDHHSGAQGHALQVNGYPQQSDDLDNDYEG